MADTKNTTSSFGGYTETSFEDIEEESDVVEVKVKKEVEVEDYSLEVFDDLVLSRDETTIYDTTYEEEEQKIKSNSPSKSSPMKSSRYNQLDNDNEDIDDDARFCKICGEKLT